MKTYRISEEEIKGLKPVAVGYKIFNNNWTTKHGDYDYKDENGNVLGTIHKVDGNIEECKWGLHFSKNPQDCFDFYSCVQWNKFAKVEAYDKIIECDKKSVTNILKIVKIYTFDEFIKLIQKKLQSYGINWSNGINWSYGINRSYGITKCNGLFNSIFCYNKSGKNYLFNKKSKEDRIDDIKSRIYNFNWYPKFNNAEELKGNLKWYETNIPEIVRVDNKTAWSFMPENMKKYIQSLPEYDEKIFNKVTGDIYD